MTIVSKLLAVCAVGVMFTLGGCATPSNPAAMVPKNLQLAKQHQKSVSVTTNGGTETSAMGKSQISDEALKQALELSIGESKAFSSVVAGKAGDYLLNVTIFNLNQPSFGLDFTVKIEAGWTLIRTDTGAVVWKEAIKSEHTATTSDAFAGVARLQMANEGAVRNNVAQGLAKVAALPL